MTRQEFVRADPPQGPVLGESRARVLAVLQAAVRPLAVDEVASRVGLHPNTARFHLDALFAQGLVERAQEERAAPGRPRTLYTATADAPRAGRRNYRLLAEILAGYLATRVPRPDQAALMAGTAWGRFLIERPVPFRRVDAAAATEQLVRSLDELGFAPEAVPDGDGRKVLLRHCPFRETAVEYGDVVCSVHLGLMRGMLAELDAPVEVTSLDSFVEPSLCVARLAARDEKLEIRRPGG